MNKDFDFKKSLGQNFLIDEKTIVEIVDSINPSKNDLVIEVGPGEGVITKELAKTNATIYSFEIDTRLKETLEKIESNNTHIVFEDFLKVDLKEFTKSLVYDKLYVVGNLPYYITTPIVKKVINELDATEVVIMMQKEVAERFMAKPCTREYGSISVYLQYNFDISKVCNVNKTCFYPQPKVDSTVIKLSKKKKEYVSNLEVFEKLIKDSFQFKRKNLRNNLKSYDLEIIEKILIPHNKSLTNRAEELSVQDYIEISNAIS